MRHHLVQIFITVALAAAAVALAASPENGDETLVDRIVAVVDQDPILLSDIRRLVALGLVESEPGENEPGENDRDVRRRALDGLIDQRLRLHDIERYDFGPLPAAEVDHQVDLVRGRFADEAALQQHLRQLGLDDEKLRFLLMRQLRVLLYVEKRLGPRVYVDPQEVHIYYDQVLAAEMARQGQGLPPFEEVREDIRDLLHEQRLNEEIETWTEELHAEAEVVDLFDRATPELPPIVKRISGPA